MIRTALKLLLPVVAAALLDKHCRNRDLRRQRLDKKRDLQVWEGEGGNPVSPQQLSPLQAR
jgi:hypothetical protein